MGETSERNRVQGRGDFGGKFALSSYIHAHKAKIKPKKSVSHFSFIQLNGKLICLFLRNKMANFKFVLPLVLAFVFGSESLRFGPDPITVESGILVIKLFFNFEGLKASFSSVFYSILSIANFLYSAHIFWSIFFRKLSNNYPLSFVRMCLRRTKEEK